MEVIEKHRRPYGELAQEAFYHRTKSLMEL